MPFLAKNKIALFALIIITGLSLYNYQQHFKSILSNTTSQINDQIAFLPQTLYQIPIGAYETIKKYSLLLGIKETNTKLLQQNNKLIIELQNTLEIKQENNRLKDLLNLKISKKIKLIAAKVVSIDIFGQHLSININKGSEEGIKKLQGVLSTQGTIGVVKEVYKHSSQVILLLSQQISIDSINQRSRVRSLITGYQNGLYTIIYPAEAPSSSIEIQKGDLFVSSGLQQSFPAGLHIGHVTKITEDPLNKTLQILLKPTASFNTLEEVFIIKKP